MAIARSPDGGTSWSIEEHPELQRTEDAQPAPGGINFEHPGFAMRVRGAFFWHSYDRGRSWKGPFAFPDFKLGGKLTSRTDYVVNGPSDCHLFLSVKDARVEADMPDRSFAARTRDGGRTFEFLGWMTGADPALARSVMSSTVRTTRGTLVTTLRRRFDLKTGYRNDLNWIDAYGSEDDGMNWKYLGRIAYPDNTGHNGNPPSLVKLQDGRLATVYGVRSKPSGIRARLSDDDGRTWGPEFFIRADARTWDIGYCCSVVRPDGKIFTAYYYATEKYYENHIAGSIWEAPAE
jgi:hypothetical protein